MGRGRGEGGVQVWYFSGPYLAIALIIARPLNVETCKRLNGRGQLNRRILISLFRLRTSKNNDDSKIITLPISQTSRIFSRRKTRSQRRVIIEKSRSNQLSRQIKWCLDQPGESFVSSVVPEFKDTKTSDTIKFESSVCRTQKEVSLIF